MGPPGTSRKGKKAWRKNIDDSEVVEAVAKETHEQRHGPAVESLSDDQLFFVDKSADAAAPAAAAARPRATRAKREMRPTRAQLILSAPQSVKPVIPARASNKKKEQGLPKPRQQQLEEATQAAAAAAAPKAASNGKRRAPVDIWGEGDDVEDSESDMLRVKLPVGAAEGIPGARRAKKGVRVPRPKIKQVEVDMAGCSYNPEYEAHQDALAVVVAGEMKKEIRKTLGPKPVPLLVDAAGVQDELAALQTDAVEEDENEIEIEGEGEDGQAEPDELAEADGASVARAKALSKKTKKDRAREARRKAAEKEEETKKALKRQRAQLDSLKSLQTEVEEETAEKEARRLRRKVVTEEKEAIQPPRLGKLKFEDMAPQVLTSDEVGGGLRQLKAYPMLANERFKSLQKRGLIEPRRPAAPRGPKRVVVYEKNARREKAEEGQAELETLRKRNTQARRKALEAGDA